jgi:hypothetical protein
MMTTTLLEQPNHAVDTAPASDILSTLVTKKRRNCLVARWLIDENSKLYCQWVIED